MLQYKRATQIKGVGGTSTRAVLTRVLSCVATSAGLEADASYTELITGMCECGYSRVQAQGVENMLQATRSFYTVSFLFMNLIFLSILC